MINLNNNFAEHHPSMWLHCHECGQDWEVPGNCGKRSCFICRRIQFKRLLSRYGDWVLGKSGLKLLTLTRANRPYLSIDWIRETRSVMAKIFRRVAFKDKIRGGLYAIEATNKGNGWNLHVHAILEADFILQSDLSMVLGEVTGDSNVCDIREIYNSKGAVQYVLKDLYKTPQVFGSEEDYNEAFKGMRFLSTFGTWYNKAQPQSSKTSCKHCGGEDVVSWFQIHRELFHLQLQTA